MGTVIEAFTADDVRAAEEPLLAAERGFSGGLMNHAAVALELTVRRELRRAGRVAGSTVVGLVGPGNNGADTLHALARLARHGVRAVAIATSASVHDGGLAALVSAGGRVLSVVDGAPGERVWLGEAAAEAYAADVVLDGLLGIGGRGGLRGAQDGARHAPVVDRHGQRAGRVLRADRTVTFGTPKPGLLLPPAAELAGGSSSPGFGVPKVTVRSARRTRPARCPWRSTTGACRAPSCAPRSPPRPPIPSRPSSTTSAAYASAAASPSQTRSPGAP